MKYWKEYVQRGELNEKKKHIVVDYMGQIAYVAQDNYLFDMSVMDNIRLGKKGATDENVIQLNKKIWEVTLNEKY